MGYYVNPRFVPSYLMISFFFWFYFFFSFSRRRCEPQRLAGRSTGPRVRVNPDRRGSHLGYQLGVVRVTAKPETPPAFLEDSFLPFVILVSSVIDRRPGEPQWVAGRPAGPGDVRSHYSRHRLGLWVTTFIQYYPRPTRRFPLMFFYFLCLQL